MPATGPDIELTLRLLSAEEAADVALLQGILERAPAYALLVEGRLPASTAAADLFAELPPGGDPSRKRVLAFHLGHEPVGCADLYLGHPEPSTAYLGLLLFDERHQGRGLGPRALAQVEEMASRSGCAALRLAVIETNRRGLAFWRREGFAEAQRRALSGYTGDAIVMQRAIDSGPRIRTARAADRDAVLRIAAAGMREFGLEPDFAGLDAEIGRIGTAHPDAICELVAVEAGEVRGSVVITACGPHAGKLTGFYLDPTQRGKGTGRRLLLAAVDAARLRGLERLSLLTWGRMQAAVALYESTGWQRGPDPHADSGADRSYALSLQPHGAVG